MAVKLLIHIGYHKTGSSFLQKLIFNNPKYGFYSVWRPQDYIEEFVIPNPFTFDPQQARAFFDQGIQTAEQRSLVPVLTHEMLSGNPWKGGYTNPQVADRLAATFPEGQVLIVIREQTSMILSLYKHRVRNELTASLDRYLDPPQPRSGFEPLFRWEYLEYHWLIQHYQQKFGQEKVLVLPYEMLQQQGSEFLAKIAQFMGTPIPDDLSATTVNPGYSGVITQLKRWTNMVCAPRYPQPNLPWQQKLNNVLCFRLEKLVPPGWGQAVDRQLQAQIRERLGDYYQTSNQISSQLIDLDLTTYNYCL